MCGIVGYIGQREAVPVLIQGLEQLEYRGYDSAGIACLVSRKQEDPAKGRRLFIAKEKGKLACLKEQLRDFSYHSHLGIGHTRWATHGEPSRGNAHPHLDDSNRIALVHNGIIENYASLKAELERKGIRFRSATDTEIAVQLIGYYYRDHNLLEAFKMAIQRLQGFFAFVVVAKDHPDKLFVFKRSNPLVIGIGKKENFVASDVTPLLPYTRQVVYLEDDEYAVLTREKVEIFSLKTGRPIRRKPVVIRWNLAQAQKGGFAHFMLKEIYEQPNVIETILKERLRGEKIHFDTLRSDFVRKLKKINRIHLVSCGTAYHAGLVGKYMMEQCLGLPSEPTVSSEFRYGAPVVGKKDLVILITQSGETADTLAALRRAKEKKALTLAVVNVVGSTIAREADSVLYTHAGPEIGVASTKAYLAQLVTLVLFTLYFSHLKKTVPQKDLNSLVRECRKLPDAVAGVLSQAKQIERCARRHYRRRNFLYLGRGYNFPTALEGALKLKEISYAHAHGYAAGEMKHGPIALVDSEQPVICIAPESRTYDKMISNIEEIPARRGIVLAIGTAGDRVLKNMASDFFPIPKVSEILSPILTVIPLQLFAYQIALLNGRNVDQPRNLAKSVTVE